MSSFAKTFAVIATVVLVGSGCSASVIDAPMAPAPPGAFLTVRNDSRGVMETQPSKLDDSRRARASFGASGRGSVPRREIARRF